MYTVDKLKEIFGVQEDKELAAIFGRKKSVVSTWRVNGIPAIIERKANELINNTGKNIVAEGEVQYLQKIVNDGLIDEAVVILSKWPRSKLHKHIAEWIEELENKNEG
jgi:hypothetical protein